MVLTGRWLPLLGVLVHSVSKSCYLWLVVTQLSQEASRPLLRIQAVGRSGLFRAPLSHIFFSPRIAAQV
jgi:hypothetical protein